MVVNGVGMVWGSIRRENERLKVHRDDRMLGEYIGPGTSKYTEYDEAVVLKTKEWLKEKKKNLQKKKKIFNFTEEVAMLNSIYFKIVEPYLVFNQKAG